MFRSKRDVDKHVADLDEKIPSEKERSLKYFTVARLYYTVGEAGLALKYLDKYCDVRPSSAQAFKFRGQVLEKASERESEEEAVYSKKTAAVEAYKASYHLDLSQKELLKKICEITVQLPIHDTEHARYWVDEGEKHFPRNKIVAKLRDEMRAIVKEREETNGNGNGVASTEESSPTSQGGPNDEVEGDNSILWSTSRIGANNFTLNGSYRMEDALNSTPGRGGNGTGNRRFPPRPSPERLANQIRQIESAQEKMSSAVLENSRSLLETQESILSELRKTREDVSRNLRENTEAVRDLRGEIGSIWREMRDELRRNADKKQEVILVKDDDKSVSHSGSQGGGSGSQKPLTMQDLQEALAVQQATMIQMQSLGMAGMFAHAARPPHVPHMPPHMFPPGLPSQPSLPQQPIPPVSTVSHQPTPSSTVNNTPVNVVITSSDKIPAPGSSAPTASLPAVNIPAQHRLGGVRPAAPVVAPAQAPEPAAVAPKDPLAGLSALAAGIPPATNQHHSYQINISSNQSALGSPFAEKDGPAVPITTSSILANIPKPEISAVSKPKTTVSTGTAKPKSTPATSTTTTASGPATPKSAAAPASSNPMDKFKPKPGSWECGGCCLRHPSDVIQCPVCQTAKPGHEEEIKAKEEAASKPPPMTFGAGGGFKFVANNNPATSTTATTPALGGFNFGSAMADKAPAATSTPTTAAASTAPEPAKPTPFTGFNFGGTQTPAAGGGFSFSGIQAIGSTPSAPSAFSLNTSKAAEEQNEAGQDEGHDDSAGAHDPHFEPIIPLPELVQVTTGEEDEEVKFQHRGKVYRYDKDAKEWKERGVGDLKILYHPERKTYRVLLRRDQVLKIACNHLIQQSMKLEPMAKSETAVTWFAKECNEEGELSDEKLAARFKLAETKDEFKKAFEEAQLDLANGLESSAEPAAPKPKVVDTNTDDVVGGDFELSFADQGLKVNTANDAKEIVEQINATKIITTLTFSGNTVGIEAAEAIGNSLKSHPELKYAHWKDMFTGKMKTEIPPALIHLSHGLMTANARLVELDLSDNAIGALGVPAIVDLLKSPTCYSLKVLKLNNTGCGVTGGKLLAKTLMETYTASKGQLALQVFVLGRSRQENEGAIALAEVFKKMGSLEEVVMPQNGIYFEGITALADAFASNPNLRILNMNDNTFTEKGAKALADALPKLQKLEVLNLGDCLLKTEGARHIAYALKENHTNLKELYMDSNEIRVAGGFAIVDAALNKDNLEKLTLDTNQFGAEGCGRIMKKLKDAGKKHLMEDIEDDEDPEDSEDEEGADDDDDNDDEEDGDEEPEGEEPIKENVTSLTSFSFGGGSAPPVASSIFGGGPPTVTSSTDPADKKAVEAPKSIFGGLNLSTTSNSLFGGSSTASSTTPSLFGGFTASTTTTASPSIFGQAATGDSSAPAAVFGTPSTIFGSKPSEASTTNIFAPIPAPAIPESSKETKGVDLSASKDLATFSALSTGSEGGFSFGKKTDGFAFSGAGASLFKTAASPTKAADDSAAAGETEDAEHDPHFEPIIPLPELVIVSTGEEDEEAIFKHRAKVYRFDKDVKQWKERGVGDIKILHHQAKNTFRVLLRRDQVHKIACNHYISQDQTLEPMQSSETALTWLAIDFSEDEVNGITEKLAVRFKLAETKDEFKKIFEECQEKLKNKPPQSALNATAKVSDNFFHKYLHPNADADDDEDYEDEETADDDQSDDSDNTMFEKICELKEIISENTEATLGKAVLKILYDEDVYGARIIALKLNEANGEVNEDEIYLCNHLIAIQTNVDVNEAEKCCTWSGLDFSVDPPRYRKFVAIFSADSDGDDARMEFVSIFQEGKELAEQSEILEQPHAGSLNPDDIYYGQGMWPDRVGQTNNDENAAAQ